MSSAGSAGERQAEAAGAEPPGSSSVGRSTASPCSEWLADLAPRLPDDLVTSEARQRAISFAGRLPGDALTALEVRLAAGPAAVDVSQQIVTASQALHLADWIEPAHLRDLLLDWARAPDPRTPFLWVEFDLEEARADPLWPVFIFRIKRWRDPVWLVDELLPRLQQAPLGSVQRSLALRALDTVPAPGKIAHVFTLRGRGSEAIRLDFLRLSPPSMMEHLRRLGRPDLASALDRPGQLLADADRFQFNFDVAESIQPRVGIEAFYDGWSGSQPRWRKLLDRLVDAGLCAAAKRDGVLGWSGHQAGPAGTRLMRFVSHIKLACLATGEVEAKAYLLAGLYRRAASGRIVPAAVGEESR